jgi:hypothetical protein
MVHYRKRAKLKSQALTAEHGPLSRAQIQTHFPMHGAVLAGILNAMLKRRLLVLDDGHYRQSALSQIRAALDRQP